MTLNGHEHTLNTVTVGTSNLISGLLPIGGSDRASHASPINSDGNLPQEK